jgi:hypothetical protein
MVLQGVLKEKVGAGELSAHRVSDQVGDTGNGTPKGRPK